MESKLINLLDLVKVDELILLQGIKKYPNGKIIESSKREYKHARARRRYYKQLFIMAILFDLREILRYIILSPYFILKYIVEFIERKL